MQINELLKVGKSFVVKNSSVILTGVGMLCIASTPFVAAKGTIKAVRMYDELKASLEEGEDISKKEIVKKTWKYYIPTALTVGIGLSATFGANWVNAKRLATLAAIYSMNEKNFKEYKEKVKNVVGEKKSEAIKDELAKDAVEKAEKPIVVPESDETLVFDKLNGRYFSINIEKLKRSINDINKYLIECFTFVTLNDVYERWNSLSSCNIPPVGNGDDVGFTVEHLLEVSYSSQLINEDQPCLVIDIHPTYIDI